MDRVSYMWKGLEIMLLLKKLLVLMVGVFREVVGGNIRIESWG